MFSVFHSLTHPVIILAPMSGVTDYPFRRIVQKYGDPSLVISEMIASVSMVREIKRTLQRQCDPQEGAAVQLAGNNPVVMAEAARMSEARGARLIDINMGCPAKKIAVNSYAGAALMKDELRASQIFEAIVKAVKIPVTVKMRKGWDINTQNAERLVKIAEESGLSWVTIHGRTRCQLYTGKADWEFIHHVAQGAKIPVIGNGDITTEESAKEVLGGTSGIMIGRGSYGRPWFLKQVRHYLNTGDHIPPPCFSQQAAIVTEHLEHIFSYYGAIQGIHFARKHLGWYSKGLIGASEFRAAAFRQDNPDSFMGLVNSFFREATYA